MRIGNILLDDRSRSVGIKRVLYYNRYVLVANRIDGRRIHYLSTEVAKFGSFYIAQFINGISRGNHTRIGGHETVHIRPNFQCIGIQRRSYDGSRIVGTSATEVGHLARNLIRRNKSRNQHPSGHILKCLAHQGSSKLRIQYMLGMFLLRFDEPARIKPFRTRQLRCNNG